MMHFEIYQTRWLRQWRWRLKAANGRILASGESYHNRMDCRAAIDLICQCNPATDVLDLS